MNRTYHIKDISEVVRILYDYNESRAKHPPETYEVGMFIDKSEKIGELIYTVRRDHSEPMKNCYQYYFNITKETVLTSEELHGIATFMDKLNKVFADDQSKEN